MSKNDVSKRYADKLGKDRPKGEKDPFGKELGDSDRRLYGLRESGYKGPIDKDGYIGGKMW